MGKGHEREGDLSVGAFIDGRREAVGTADDEDEVTSGTHLALQEIGKLDGAVLFSVFIEQEHVHGGREETEDRFAFSAFDLVLRERLGVFEIGEHDDFERHIMDEPLAIVVDKRDESAINRFPS